MLNTDRIRKGIVMLPATYFLVAALAGAVENPDSYASEDLFQPVSEDSPSEGEPVPALDGEKPSSNSLPDEINTPLELAPHTNDSSENPHRDIGLNETAQELNESPPAAASQTPSDSQESTPISEYDHLGYRVVEGPNGLELDYNPQYDQRLTGEHLPNPVIGSYREFERQNMHEALHRFLNNDLNQIQRELLQEFLMEQISGPQKSTASMMAEEMRSKELSPESFAQLAHLAIALYYYRNYVYDALVRHASKETDINESGLISPHVIAMSEQLVSQLPNAKPFSNLALVLPVAIRLFYINNQLAREVESQVSQSGAIRNGDEFRIRAHAASSYGFMLGLFAQASAGFLSKYTTFQNYPAGMLASTYRNWKIGDFWQVAIDGFMTLQNLKHRRGLIMAAIAATVLNHYGMPNKDFDNRSWYEHPLDANYMMPTLLATCMTHDWGSSIVTGIILAMNQSLYMGRDFFLNPGHLYEGSQPYVMGYMGSALSLAVTLAVYWKNIPTLDRAGEGVSYTLTEAADWMSYIFMMKGVVRPDWERSGFIHWLTEHYARYSFSKYPGEYNITTEHTYGSESERIQGQDPGLSKKISVWLSYFMGYDKEEYAENYGNSLDVDANSIELPEESDIQDNMSAWEEFNVHTPPEAAQ